MSSDVHDIPFDLFDQTALAPMDEVQIPLVESLGAGFDIYGLLRFLPDLKLKREIERLVEDALSIDVASDGGLALVDSKRNEILTAIGKVEAIFNGTKLNPGPVSLAYELHRRLTGLRADFTKTGTDAVAKLGVAITKEKRRLDELAAAKKREEQLAADAIERDRIAGEAKAAEERGAPTALVEELKTAAKTASAPPVAGSIAGGQLGGSSLVANWKSRFAGTPAELEPNPDVDEMNADQQAKFKAVCAKVASSEYPVAMLSGINWSYVNARAKAEKTTFSIPEFEAYDAGSLRGKRR